MKLETVPCDTLSFDPANLRKHGKKNLDAIKASLRRFGQQKPIVVDANGIVLAGNGTLAAAQELGWSEIQIVRTDLAGTQATAFGIADNRSAELAEWDEKLGDVLASLKAEDFPLEEIGFDAADLEELSPEAAGRDVDAEPQIDKAEELRAKWGVELGQVWQLGNHRIICGDSTSADVVKTVFANEQAKLLISDPPYGIGYEYATHDDSDNKANAELVRKAFELGPQSKVWTCGLNNLARDISRFGSAKVLVWFKKFAAAGNGLGGASVWEPILVVGKPETKKCSTDVFEIQTDREKINGESLRDFHTCPKPVSLFVSLLESFSVSGDIIHEPFSGSGTTLLACERTGRKCRAIELNPAYVAVAIQRWADATGKEPKKL